MSDTLADAFVALHAEGTQLAPEVQAQATAAATSAETTNARGVAAGGTAGGVAAGEAIEQGVEEGAERGAREGAAGIVKGVTAGGAAAGAALHQEMVIAGTEAGDEAGDRAGRQIASGIAKGGAAGAAALRAELEGAAVGVGGRFGNAFGKGFLNISPGLALAGGAAAALAVGVGLAANEALQAQKAEDALTQSLLNNAKAANIGIGAYNDLAAEVQDLTGYEDEQVMAAEAVLTRFKLTGEQIEEIIPRVADFAHVTGQDMPAAAGSLGKALLGNTRALKTIGGEITITGDRATDFANLMDVLNNKVGGFAERGAARLDGQLRKLKANFGDLGETAGNFFLPTLTLISSGLNFGADAAAEGAQGTSLLDSVLRSTLPGMAAFGDAQRVMNHEQAVSEEVTQDAAQAIGIWVGELSSGKIEVSDYRDRLQTLVASAKEEGLAEAEITAILRSGRGALRQHIQETLGLADAHHATTVAAQQQQLAELSLAGGFVGVAANMQSFRQAQDALAEAQAKVNRLERAGKTDTNAYREAVTALRDANIGAFTSGLTLTESVTKLGVEMKQQGASGREVREEVRLLGQQYGLSREQIADLIADTDRMIRKQNEVRGDVTMHFHAEGLDEALRKTAELADILAGIPSALASVGGGPGRRDMPNDPRQQGDSGTGPMTGGARTVPQSTSVEIELDGKLIYESNEAVGRRQRVRFSGRDDG